MKPRNTILYQIDEATGVSDPAPGTGEEAVDETTGVPAAEPSTTDSTESQPGPIPYSRFKEVNDARRELAERHEPFANLEQAGYDADNLQRLAAWEMEYNQDPEGVWLRHATTMEGLPDEVKAVVMKHAGEAAESAGAAPKDDSPKVGDADQPTSSDESPSDADPPEWAKPLIADHEAAKVTAEQQATSSLMDTMVEAWKEWDIKEGLVDKDGKALTGEPSMIRAIQLSATQEAETAAEILERARSDYLTERESILKSNAETIRSGDTKTPRSVPGGGSGSTPVAVPTRPKSLREATKLAQAASDTGRLER